LKLQAIDILFTNLPLSNADNFISRQDILKAAIELSASHFGVKSFTNHIYFGDGVWDFWTTSQLEIPFVGVAAKDDGKLRNLGAQNVIKDFSEIAQIRALLEEM
jgi:hypothetical protein